MCFRFLHSTLSCGLNAPRERRACKMIRRLIRIANPYAASLANWPVVAARPGAMTIRLMPSARASHGVASDAEILE